MAEIIDGKAAAERLRQRLKVQVDAFVADQGYAPGLAVVIVGDHPASRAYVRTKTRVAGEIGIAGDLIQLDETVGQATLLERIDALNADPKVHGILVQLPLPESIDASAVLAAIDPRKGCRRVPCAKRRRAVQRRAARPGTTAGAVHAARLSLSAPRHAWR